MIAWKQSDKHTYKELTKGTAFVPSPFHIPIDTPKKVSSKKASTRHHPPNPTPHHAPLYIKSAKKQARRSTQATKEKPYHTKPHHPYIPLYIERGHTHAQDMPYPRLPHPHPPHYPSMPRMPKEAKTHHQHKALHKRRTQESKSQAFSSSPLLSMRRMQSTQRIMRAKSYDC